MALYPFPSLATPDRQPGRRTARHRRLLGLALCALTVALPAAHADDDALVTGLAIEDLLKTEVNSVLKHSSALANTPAAITVIRREDIDRLGATTLPDLLRIVPGLHVGQIDGNKWAVGSRGLNGFFGSKLLVLVDGRSVYNTVYSGVYWDAQDIPFDNIDHIEVIRGPGAALWGANAVNGIINIVTRSAHQTLGGHMTLQAGNLDQGSGAVRWGAETPDGAAWRLYAQTRHRDEEDLPGRTAGDTTRAHRMGFRIDSAPETNRWMVTGEVFDGRSGGAPYPFAPTTTEQRGGHLVGEWQQRLSADSQLKISSYVDHYRRKELASGSVLEETVFDGDIQHTVTLSPTHQLVWGGGYRHIRFESEGSAKLSFTPAAYGSAVHNLFAQDEWTVIPERLTLILGTKLEHQTGYIPQWQPNLRISWTPDSHQTIWSSLARAVRAPNRLETMVRYSGPELGPVPLQGNPQFRPERETSLEFGWRTQISEHLASDLSLYHTRYLGLQTIEFNASGPSLMYFNNAEGTTRGIEWSLDWQVANTLQIRGGATFYREHLNYEVPPASPVALIAFQGGFPTRQFFVRSLWDIDSRQRLDLTLRAANRLQGRQVAGYGTLDGQWTWRADKALEFSVIGRNLAGPLHREFGDQPFFQETRMRRELLLQAQWKF